MLETTRWLIDHAPSEASFRRKPQPSDATIERWLEQGGLVKATDGCRVEMDGTCPHGCPSWLLELGLI